MTLDYYLEVGSLPVYQMQAVNPWVVVYYTRLPFDLISIIRDDEM